MIGFLVLVCVLVLVLINVPIAVALSIASVIAMLATQGVGSLPNVPLTLYQGATSFPLIAIPLFILAAAIMNTSGISHRLIDFCQALVGWVRGALAQVNVLSHMFFAEISGSAVAGVAATASIIMPAMKKRGYPGPFTAAVTSSTATLAIIIPPSIPMILYAVMAGTSVVQMFVAGIVPGLLAAGGFMALCYWYALRHNWPVEQVFRWGALWRAFKHAFWALTLPIIILGGIFGGIVTATEGAALAVVAALLVGGLIYRELDMEAPARRRHRRRGADRHRDAAGRRVGPAGALSHRGSASAAHRRGDVVRHEREVGDPRDPQRLLPHHRNVPALGGSHRAGGADRDAGGDRGGDRSGALRPHRDAQPGDRPADTPVASVLLLTCSIAKESVWDVSKANIPFIGILLAVLLLITYVPVVTLGLVDFFYR